MMMMDRDHPMDVIQQYPVLQGYAASQPANLPKQISCNDRRFLAIFIVGTYFGPDLKNEVSKRSALQILAQGLPAYTFDELGGSFVKLSEFESIYYYILRTADPSCVLKLHSLHKFIQGHLPPLLKEVVEDDRQFTSFFPEHLHRQTRHKRRFKVFEGIVFIDDPDVSCIKPEDLERFKRLTVLNDLKIDKDEAWNYRHTYGPKMDRDVHASAGAYANVQDGTALAIIMPDGFEDQEMRRKEPKWKPNMPTSMPQKNEKTPVKNPETMGNVVLMFSSAPGVEQWNSSRNEVKPSIAFTGTATARQAGPSIGLVDIGTCDDAYLFRIALPGVKKDQRKFSCEIESDGKIIIKGITTTGEQNVMKKSRTFQMKTQSLCPPGPFTVSFQLPGPVDPRQFTGNFGSDGILEGIVMKHMDSVGPAGLIFEC